MSGFSQARVDKVPVLLLFVLAVLTRVSGLGKWCLAVDEFYFSKGVRFILESGIPMFPGGGYYVRGILLQYLTAIPVSLLDNLELAVRIVPLLFGALSIPMFYLLCRKFMGRFESVLCAGILLLSSWHIELSRFARMYMPFQFFFLLFLYNVHSGYRGNDARHRAAAWIVAALTVFVYEGSVIPALLLSAMLLTGDAGKTGRGLALFAAMFAALIALNLAANLVDYRTLGVSAAELAVPRSATAAGNTVPIDSPVVLPDMRLLAFAAGSRAGWAVLALLAFAGSWLAVRTVRRYDGDRPTASLYLAVVPLPVFPLLHQFGLLAIFGVLLAMNRRDIRRAIGRDLPYWAAYAVLSAAFWGTIAWLSGNGPRVRHFLAGYPPVKYTVIEPFLNAVPLWAVFLFATAAVSVLRLALFPRPDDDTFPATMLVLCAVLMSVFDTPYRETRYSFFYFPLLILVAAMETCAIRRLLSSKAWPALGGKAGAVLCAVPFLVFLSTEDFHLRHVTAVSAPELNFRTGPYLRFSDHWYPRFDFEGAGRFVDREYTAGDVVAVEQVAMSEYLRSPFINYVERKSERYEGIARKNGSEEVWSGRPLVSDPGQLAASVPENGRNCLWLIGVVWDFHGQKSGLKNRYEKMAAEHGLVVEDVFLGSDGRTGVLKVRRGNVDNNIAPAGVRGGAEGRGTA